jgi:hypothetical protein
MSIRKNTFLIKRSGVPGKIPNSGDLQLGELALNFADAILYASGTTSNSILPIGWDRVSRTGDTMTGTLYVPTISATSINKVDYIVFNTGTTSATTVAGTVYFDNTEKSLSYNTSINQGVTVNLGQQNYIRVFNNSGTDIQRGKALEILSAYSGLPSVTLAINKHTGFNIIGVSAEIIPNNSEGIVITNGIINNIELTGMTVGSLIYASDTVPGNLDDITKYLNFPLTARTNEVGFVVQTGVTTGKLFVNINNENSVLTLTDLERNVLEGNTISTGAFEYTGMTTASTTTFNVAPLKGWLVKNTYTYALLPDVQSIEYTGGTNISVTNIATADSTYILINSGLTITQQVTFPTPQERRENIFLGKVNHPNRSTILNINNTLDYDVSPMSALRDLWSPIRLINDGIIPSPNGANLSFNTSAGVLWGNGINWHNNQLSPNNVSIAAKVPSSFFYRTQTGGTTGSVTVINPRNYDVGGVITSIGNANLDSATNQRIYMYPSGVINVLYGQTVYTSLATAVAAVQSEVFIPYPNAESSGILIGVLSVRNDIGTDGQPLTNASYAKFTFVSKFGESFGGTGGLSTTTLQQAYDNSSQPEITINSTLDGLSIKNGTGNPDNITRLFEGITATNGSTSFIRADGYISGTTFQSNSFIANNGGATATTFNILTLGSGTSITNLGVDINGRVVTGTTGGSTFTGGTVTGPTNFTNGLTANTISATTYYNLPIDVYSTGGTYNGGNIYITNNTGGTFNISGLTASGFSANYYGSFSDTTIQPVTGSSSPTVWKYNTTELSNGISVVNSSQIKVANKGVYEIGYSAQLEKTQGTEADVTIWASINGTPVTRSSSITSLVANSALQLPFVSFIFELEANDYVEFYFSSSSQYVQITTFSGLTSPTRPVAPSVIIVAKQVGLSVTDNLGGNYLPLSGGTLTGGTIFNSGLTASTISATTYQNLPSGSFGVSNSNGIYTYYNSFNNAISAATSGQTVEMFGDVIETGNVSITLKDGVTINGNGHTYTLSYSGNTNAIIDGDTTNRKDCIINNIIIKRTNGINSLTDSLSMLINGNTTVYCNDVWLISSFGTGLYVFGQSSKPAKVIGVNIKSDNTGVYINGDGSIKGTLVKCYSISNGIGIYLDSNGSEVYDSYGESSTNYGVYNKGIIYNTTSVSHLNSSMYLEGEIYGSRIICNWNDSNGHGIVCVNNNGLITNSSINVTNSGSYCLYSSSSINVKYSNNSFKGSITPITSNISQGIINVKDNQGNILI